MSRENRIEYCYSVGVDYVNVEKYYDAVSQLNKAWYKSSQTQTPTNENNETNTIYSKVVFALLLMTLCVLS